MLDAGNFVGEDQAMIWFDHPPVCVLDWAKPGKIRQVEFSPTSYALGVDIAKIPGMKPIPFCLERRIAVPFEKNWFFSSAPLQTTDHLGLIGRLEAVTN